MVQGIPNTTFSLVKPEGSYPCAASAGNRVPYDVCLSITQSISRNTQFCRGCSCPWRLCRICLEQGFTDEDARVRDPAIGLCAFHLAHGTDANRNESELDHRKAVLARERGIRRPPLRAPAAPAVRPPHSMSAVGNERWPTAKEVAARISRDLPAHELALLRLLADNSDMPDAEMAERLGVTRSKVDSAMNRMAKRFNFPILLRTDNTRVSRRRAILGEACSLWMERDVQATLRS